MTNKNSLDEHGFWVAPRTARRPATRASPGTAFHPFAHGSVITGVRLAERGRITRRPP